MEDQDYPYCPARDKHTKQCFGLTYFKLKPGPGPHVDCPGDCRARREWENSQHDKLYSQKGFNYGKTN